MRKYLSIVFAVLAITAIFTSSVLAAPASKNASLLSVNYNQGGVVLIFQTSGLTKADLKGATLYANSNWYKMYCTFIDNTTKVRCTVASKMAGKGEFYATLAEFGFWGSLPQPKTISCQTGEIPWYSYNEYYNGTFTLSSEIPVWLWEQLEADGSFDALAKIGLTYEITGAFCSSEELKPV